MIKKKYNYVFGYKFSRVLCNWSTGKLFCELVGCKFYSSGELKCMSIYHNSKNSLNTACQVIGEQDSYKPQYSYIPYAPEETEN